MRKFLLSAVIASAAFTAAPAAAQPAAFRWTDNPSATRYFEREIGQLDRRIDRSVERRRISQREAAGLRRETTRLERDLYRFSRGGIDRREAAQLNRGLASIQKRLRFERNDWDDRRR